MPSCFNGQFPAPPTTHARSASCSEVSSRPLPVRFSPASGSLHISRALLFLFFAFVTLLCTLRYHSIHVLAIGIIIFYNFVKSRSIALLLPHAISGIFPWPFVPRRFGNGCRDSAQKLSLYRYLRTTFSANGYFPPLIGGFYFLTALPYPPEKNTIAPALASFYSAAHNPKTRDTKRNRKRWQSAKIQQYDT